MYKRQDIYYGTEEDKPIEVLIGEKLIEKKQTLSCAESCTGGAIAMRLTANSGASEYFSGSAVTYSPSSKTKLLGVPKYLMDQNGVVSLVVAEAMALGAQKKFGPDFAVAKTGNAGPSKENQIKDIGTVCVAIATPEKLEGFKCNMGKIGNSVINKTLSQLLEIFSVALLIFCF